MATQRRWRVGADVIEEIWNLAREGYTPAQIREDLEHDERFRGRVPHSKTIERIYAGRPNDPSGTWSLGDVGAEDPRPILDVLAYVQALTGGRVQAFTRKEAEWVSRLRRAASTFGPLETWQIARQYVTRENQKQDTEDLDSYVAFAPRFTGLGPDAKLEEVTRALEEYVAWLQLHHRLWPHRPTVQWMAMTCSPELERLVKKAMQTRQPTSGELPFVILLPRRGGSLVVLGRFV